MDPSSAATPGWLSIVFQLSQLLYFVTVLVVGVRLLWLSHRTGGMPERLLGLQFLVGSGIAWPVVLFGLLSIVPGTEPAPHIPWMIGLGYLGLDVSLVFQLLFVRCVFRPEEAWARALVVLGAVYIAASYVALGLSGHFRNPVFAGLWYWLHYLPPALCACWVTYEAFRYYGILRKRLALGLADPVVTNRFLLWGSASVCGMVIVALGASPTLYQGLDLATVAKISSAVLSAMSLLGVVAVALYWLTFFPTRAYLGWIARRAPSTA